MLCTCETQVTQHMISMQEKLPRDFHAKAEILQSTKNRIKDPEVVSRSWGWEHNLQPCYVYL